MSDRCILKRKLGVLRVFSTKPNLGPTGLEEVLICE